MGFGTLAFDTLQTSDSKNTGTNKTLDTSFVYNGSAKAWSNYSGSGTTFRDSFNHSSATDHGTGAYTVTLTNSMSNTNYSYTASSTDGGGGRSSVFSPLDFDNYLTGSMRGINNDTGNATEDTECVSSTFNGDLA